MHSFYFFSLRTFPLVYLLFCKPQKRHGGALAGLLTQPTFSWCPQPVPQRHNHRGQELLSHLVFFFFTALISSLARLKQCKSGQLGPCQCPALQSLLCSPLWFRAPSFPLPFLDLLVFSSGDVAELCSEVTQVIQRAERKAAVTPFIKTVHRFLPSIESK